jgi:hypothetical protein
LVSTVAPPILAVLTVFDAELAGVLELDEPVEGLEPPELPLPELPQAATAARAAAAKAVDAHHRLRIVHLRFGQNGVARRPNGTGLISHRPHFVVYTPDYVSRGVIVQCGPAVAAESPIRRRRDTEPSRI